MNSMIARTVIRRTAGVSMRRLMINNNNCSIVKARCVPNKIHHFSSVATNAHDLLQRELEEEMKAGTDEIPQDLEELKNKLSADWRIVDDDTSGSVKLFSKGTSSPKVAVIFHCQDTLEAEYDEEQEQEEGNDPAVSVRFSVTATKGGKTMVFTCISEKAEASVETVSITTDLEGAQATGKVAPELYQGPEFTLLAVDLQDALNDFVALDCGINQDVAAFISMYADYKEQIEYIKWIKQAQSIIS